MGMANLANQEADYVARTLRKNLAGMVAQPEAFRELASEITNALRAQGLGSYEVTRDPKNPGIINVRYSFTPCAPVSFISIALDLAAANTYETQNDTRTLANIWLACTDGGIDLDSQLGDPQNHPL